MYGLKLPTHIAYNGTSEVADASISDENVAADTIAEDVAPSITAEEQQELEDEIAQKVFSEERVAVNA